MLREKVVENGDGLYKDIYEDGRYIYKGTNPNNYITFNDEDVGWRIISVEKDDTIKIIRASSIENRQWESSNNNDWEVSEIKEYLNNEYLLTISKNVDKIESHTWSIGPVTFNNNDLSAQIKSELGI